MKLNLRPLYCTAVLFWILANQIEAIAAAPQSSPGQPDVQFFLTALTKDGSPAVLQDTALSVQVDKAVAQVKGVRAVNDDPLLFAVAVDVSRSNDTTANSIKEAAVQLFQSLAIAQNQGYLVLFNHNVAMSQRPISASEAKKELDSATFGGGTAVYDAIEQTCTQKLSRSGNPARSRRIILLISDGEDNQSHVTRQKAEQAALEEGVSVFSIVTTGSMSGRHGEKFLVEVSQVTGGIATDNDSLKRSISLSLAAVRAQWAVTLISPQPADRRLHSMQTKYTQKDARISAPGGVFIE